MEPQTADQVDPDFVLRHNPLVWLESKGVVRLLSGRTSKPGQFKANVLQRRIFALQAARRRAGRPCFGIGLKPRKRGFSTAVSALHYTELCGQPIEAVIVGNKLETSETVFRMMQCYGLWDEFAKTGKWSSPFKTTTEKMQWQHGSILSQSTAKSGESIRGQTPQAVHGTEVAHWEQEEEVFLALMNAIPDDPSASVWLESTPKGRGGAFYDYWQKARWPRPDECPAGQEDYWRQWEGKCPDQPDAIFAEWEFVRVFAAWFEFEEAALKLDEDQKKHIQSTLDGKAWYHGERALLEVYGNVRETDGGQRLGQEVETCDVWEQLAWRRMIIQSKCKSDPGKFDQEYPRDPHSCFLASGRTVFDADAIEHYQAEILPGEFGTLDSNISADQPNKAGERVTWRRAHPDDAIFTRWEKPIQGCRYLLTIDTAEGEDQAGGRDPDRHSVLVLRAPYMDEQGVLHKARLVCRVKPPSRVPIHVLVEWAHLLHLHYHALVIPEMNNSGLAYLTGARIRGTPIWKRKEFNPRSGKKEEKLGWRTTDVADYGGIRTTILDTLGEVLREREIDLNCANLVLELASFVDNGGRMEAGRGAHDDDVLALAIGLYNIDAATGFIEAPVARPVPADIQRMIDKQAGAETRGPAHFW